MLDVTGAPVEVRAMQRQVGWLPDGDSLVIESAVVAEFAPYFQQVKVGGLLSPQLLAGDGEAAVLDLRVPELRIEPFDDALHRVGASVLTDNQIRICTDTNTPLSNRTYAVLVTARGSEAWLELDTGAEHTSIIAESPLVSGVRLEPGGETMGVSGRLQGYSVARNLMISFGGAHATLDVQVVETTAGGCGSNGHLGRDALGRCALVLARESLGITCG